MGGDKAPGPVTHLLAALNPTRWHASVMNPNCEAQLPRVPQPFQPSLNLTEGGLGEPPTLSRGRTPALSQLCNLRTRNHQARHWALRELHTKASNVV